MPHMEQEHPSSRGGVEGSQPDFDRNPDHNPGSERGGVDELLPALTVVVSQLDGAANVKGDGSRTVAFDGEKKVVGVMTAARKGFLPRSESEREQCSFTVDFDRNPDHNPGSERGGVDELLPALTVVVSQLDGPPNVKGDGSRTVAFDGEKKVVGVMTAARKGFLPRSESEREQCRVCQQQTEEPLIDLGCGCRGELAKAHRSCIEIWFQTRGSNKCEICQQVAVNVPSPDAQQITNYWVWRVGSSIRSSNIGREGHETRCFRPLWVAFAILIGGLLLDVLISVSLGVSALPVNIIIGVLIVLGLATVLRLILECCNEWGSSRHVQGTEVSC